MDRDSCSSESVRSAGDLRFALEHQHVVSRLEARAPQRQERAACFAECAQHQRLVAEPLADRALGVVAERDLHALEIEAHDELEVPGVGTLRATLINAGIPTIFVAADAIGYTGSELQDAINGDAKALAMFEAIRAHGAVRMGLIRHVEEASVRQHTPKVAFVAPPADYRASSGKRVAAGDVDLLVRALSMGKLHHAMMGTAAVAIGTAAAIPGTLVNLAAGGGPRTSVRFGHPSGTLRVGAEARRVDGVWTVTKAIMSRSARVLMEGWVRVPGDAF